MKKIFAIVAIMGMFVLGTTPVCATESAPAQTEQTENAAEADKSEAANDAAADATTAAAEEEAPVED